MGYSSASEARQAREALGKALEALQQDEDIPEEVLGVAHNLARSVGALFEAEFASTEVDGKTCVKSALGTLSQTLALLQDVKTEHESVQAVTESIADVISILFPLTNKPSVRPDAASSNAPASGTPSSAPPPSSRPPARNAPPSGLPVTQTRSSRPPSNRPVPAGRLPSSRPPTSRPSSNRPASSAPPSNRRASVRPDSVRPPTIRPAGGAPSNRPFSSQPASGVPSPIPTSMLPPPPPIPTGERLPIEANLGATTQSNFYVGFSGEIAHGGVFLATYEILPKDTSVTMLVTLPGGLDFECEGYVRFVRDPMDFASESAPGIGIQFEGLPDDARDLVLRFVRKRPPIFYDV